MGIQSSFDNVKGEAAYLDFILSNNSEVFVLVESIPKAGPSKFKISKLTERLEERKFIDLTLDSKNIVEVNFELADESLLCNGLYSEGYKYSPNGAFTFTVNPFTQAIENVNPQTIDWALIEKGLVKKDLSSYKKNRKNKAEWDPNTYKLSKIKTKANNNKYFTAEQIRKAEETTAITRNNTTSMSTINYYLYKAIYVVQLNADNEITRMDKILKNQAYSGGLGSVMELEDKGDLYFMFTNLSSIINHLKSR